MSTYIYNPSSYIRNSIAQKVLRSCTSLNSHFSLLLFFSTLIYEIVVKTIPESRLITLWISINEQEPMRDVLELFVLDQFCEPVIDLFESFQISSLLNNEVSSIHPNHSG